jgi:hypothetical protein
VLCTVALSMGVDCPGITRIVQYGFWPEYDIASLWQRICRAARRPGMIAEAYVFLNRSLFHMAFPKPGSGAKTTPWGDAMHTPLRNVEFECVRSVGSSDETQACGSGCSGVVPSVEDDVRSKAGKLIYPRHILQFVAAPCYRRFILCHLPAETQHMKMLAKGIRCCNGRHCMSPDKIGTHNPILPLRMSTSRNPRANAVINAIPVHMEPLSLRFAEEIVCKKKLLCLIPPVGLFSDALPVFYEYLRTSVFRPEAASVQEIQAQLMAKLGRCTFLLRMDIT